MAALKNKNAALGFVFLTVLIDVMGFGIILPIIPKLISQHVGGDLTIAAEYGGWLLFIFALMQFISAPLLGNLSDRFGRRPILLISLFTLGIDSLFLAFAPSILWLFVGRALGGLTGGGFGVASAYIADISKPEERSKNFGLLNSAFGLGFILGPVLGGILSKWGIHAPFIVAAGLSFANVLYGYIVLPESLEKEKRRPFEWHRANPIGTFIQLKKFPIIAGLLFAYTFIYCASHSMESIWAYYMIEKFKWTESLIGYSLGFIGIMLALTQGVLVRIILPKIGDKKGVVIGLSIQVVALFLFSIINQEWMVLACGMLYAFGGISAPALQSITTSQVPESAQGELQGGISSLVSLTAIISPPIMTYLFASFSGKNATLYFPGMPFIFAAFLLIIGIIFVIQTLRKY